MNVNDYLSNGHEYYEKAAKTNNETVLHDKLMPKTWKCHVCGRKNRTGKYADSILMENFKYIEQCVNCGTVHLWKLELSEEFKEKVVKMMWEMVEK